jgi:hypothetical protein
MTWFDKDELINQLYKLKDVKYHEETGVVSMKQGEIWYALTKTDYQRNGKLVADYEALKINCITANFGTVPMFIEPNRYIWTLNREYVCILSNQEFLGIIDEATNSYISFPPVIYQHNDKNFYDQDLNKIASGMYVKIAIKDIQTFQHIQIINDDFVLIPQNTKEYIETNILMFLGEGDNLPSLYDTKTQTLFPEMSDYIVKQDEGDNPNNETFRGFIIPNYTEDMIVYEIDGVWLGFMDETYQLLSPRWPKSGAITKPARM